MQGRHFGLLILLAAMPAAAGENDRPAVAEAAARFGCEARAMRPLKAPHDGVWEVRCAGGMIIWLHRQGGAWTLRPIG